MSRWERMGYSTQNLPWTDLWELPDDDSTVGKAIYRWGKELKAQGEPETLVVADMPEEVRQALEQVALQGLSELRKDVREQFSQAFREPVSRTSNGESFLLSVHRKKPLLNIDFSLEDDQKTLPDFEMSQTEIVPSPLALTEFSNRYVVSRDGEEPILVPEVFDAWCQSVAQTLTDDIPGRGFYLPAARSGIVLGYKILVAELVRQSSLRSGQQAYFPTLPGITTEFLGNLISLDQRMRSQQHNADLENVISFIENEVLQGEIDLDESAGLPYPEIAYESASGKFTLDQTSSMVSELAPLILFLKYLVRSGDLLILEEPESHLHPAAQLQLARGIARLVNAGVQVLITTHSSDFKGQIDNLLSMSNVSKETAESQGLDPEDCLDPEQVSAYGFRIDPHQAGSVVYPLPVGSDVGIEDEEFLPIAEVLYEQAIQFQRNRLR